MRSTSASAAGMPAAYEAGGTSAMRISGVKRGSSEAASAGGG